MSAQNNDYQIDFIRQEDVLILVFPGSINTYESTELRYEIVKNITQYQIFNIIYDFTNVDFIDSSGIGMFINIHNEVEKMFSESKIKLKTRFCNFNTKIKESFTAMNLFKIFSVDSSREESIAAIHKP